MQKEFLISYINPLKSRGKKGKKVTGSILLTFIIVASFYIVFIGNENSPLKTISSKLISVPSSKAIKGDILFFQSTSKDDSSEVFSTSTTNSTLPVNKVNKKEEDKSKTSTLTPSPILTPTFTPSPTFSPTPISTIISTQRINDFAVREYDGPPLPASQEKKDLLVLDFDSEVKGWIEDKTKNVEKKQGPKNQAISIKDNSFVLQNGEVFAHAGTLSFWLKFEKVERDSGEIPILNWNFDGLEDKYQPWLFEMSYVKSHDLLYFSVYDETNEQYDVSAELKNPLDWHYITVTWELTKKPYKRVLYIDSKKAVEDIFPFVPSTKKPSAFKIGGTLGDRKSGEFLIDELVLTNFAKSEEEVAVLE